MKDLAHYVSKYDYFLEAKIIYSKHFSEGSIMDLLALPNGNIIYSNSKDRILRVVSPTEEKEYNIHFRTYLHLLPNGKIIGIGEQDYVYIINPYTFKIELNFTGHGSAQVDVFCVLKDNTKIVSTDSDDIVLVWDYTTGNIDNNFTLKNPEQMFVIDILQISNHEVGIVIGNHSTNGKLERYIEIWDFKHGILKHTLYTGAAFPTEITTPLGLLINSQGQLKIWNQEWKLIASQGVISGTLHFFEQNKVIILSETEMQVWDLNLKECIGSFIGTNISKYNFGILIDNRICISCDKKIYIFDLTKKGYNLIPDMILEHNSIVTGLITTTDGRIVVETLLRDYIHGYNYAPEDYERINKMESDVIIWR